MSREELDREALVEQLNQLQTQMRQLVDTVTDHEKRITDLE